MEFKKIIKNIREDRNLTQEDVAIGANINAGTYQKLELGQRKDPRLSTVITLANFFNVSIDYLAGESDQLTNKATLIVKQLNYDHKEAVIDFASDQLQGQERSVTYETNAMDLFEVSEKAVVYNGPTLVEGSGPNTNEACVMIEGLVSAGAGIWQFDNLGLEYWLPKEEVPDNYDTVVRVSGHSMEPKIHDKDILFIKSDVPVDQNAIGIFQVNSKNYVKRLRMKGNKYYLESLNPKHKDIYFKSADEVRTIGAVVSIYSR